MTPVGVGRERIAKERNSFVGTPWIGAVMKGHTPGPRWRATLVGAALALALAAIPGTAWAVTTYSPDNQLTKEDYAALGLAIDDSVPDNAVGMAPYDASSEGATTTLFSHSGVYVAANGANANNYTLRSKLNTMRQFYTKEVKPVSPFSPKVVPADPKTFTNVYDKYGGMHGAYPFYKLSNKKPDTYYGGIKTSPLSDNTNDVLKDATNNGFDGIYATSVAYDQGSGYKDHIAELRVYGDNASMTTEGGVKIAGGFAVKLYELDASGRRSEVASLSPSIDSAAIDEVVAKFPRLKDAYRSFTYLDNGYLQENDAMFEVQAGDVDNDGVDEIFAYVGIHHDVDGVRQACIDMWDLQGSEWVHSEVWVDCGQASHYVTPSGAGHGDCSWHAPVVTMVTGNLDRAGGDELAVTTSAPSNHQKPSDVARCHIYTWDSENGTLTGVPALDEEVGVPYIPLSTPDGSAAMVSAGCAFGTFATGNGTTADAFVIAGWDCDGASTGSYHNFSYAFVYFDQPSGRYVVRGYDADSRRRALGRDAKRIMDSAMEHLGDDERYFPTLAPFAVACARLQGLDQISSGGIENDAVLLGGDVYDFMLFSPSAASTEPIGSMSLTSAQANQRGHKKGKDQVWIGDVRVGAVTGDSNYKESFLAVTGVRRDDDPGDDDDYYWMDISHFTAQFSKSKFTGYQTGEEGVICEGVRVNDTYGTWVSLCLPNVDHKGVQVRFKAMDKFYTAPQLLAVIEDSPYFQDLQDAYGYLNYGGTNFGQDSSSTTGTGVSVEGAAGGFMEGTANFLFAAKMRGELQATVSYDHESASTLSYGATFEAHAGEGNKAVVYTVPLIYYHYEYRDPSVDDDWHDTVSSVYLKPTIAMVGEEIWDASCKKLGMPRLTRTQTEKGILGNVTGDPSSYTLDALTVLPGSTTAFSSNTTTTVTNSSGSTVSQRISVEEEKSSSIGGGVALAYESGWGVGFLGNEGLAGVCFDASAGGSHITSNATGFDFEGLVDNVPEKAEGRSFDWQLRVCKSDEKMPDDGTKPSDNQYWIVGYAVSNVTTDGVGAVSGLAVTGTTDHSVTLSWNPTLKDDSPYQYGVVMVAQDGTGGTMHLVDQGATSYTWEGLVANTTYQFYVVPASGTDEQSATEEGVKSPTVSAKVLPSGHTFELDGANVVGAADASSRKATVAVGGELKLQETALYQQPSTDPNNTDGYESVEPTFHWYRLSPYNNTGKDGQEWTFVGKGLDVTYRRDRETALSEDSFEEGPTLAPAGTSYTSTLTIPSVSAEDDGSMWRCDVYVSDVVVYSQVVTLDVTHTIVNSTSSSFEEKGSARILPGLLSIFRRANHSEIVTIPDAKPDPDDAGGEGQDASQDDAKQERDGTGGGSESASRQPSAGASGTPNTGDAMPSPTSLALLGAAGVTSLLCALLLTRRRSG